MNIDEIESKAQDLLLQGIAKLDVNKTFYNCPNCGKEISTETCDCGFDINETLSCPYKVSLRCVHTSEKCEINGLNFEDCPLYLQKSGI